MFSFLKKNKDKDVLSFPLNFSLKEKKYLGDIVISKEKMIKQAKYPIVFTGAGCSTSIGIPDYRSGN